MSQPLGGTGLGLPVPQNLFPTELFNSSQDISTNKFGLAPGDAFIVPAGVWWIRAGHYCFVQYKDPVTQIWSGWDNNGNNQQYVKSDGVNVRVANLTGCPIGGIVVNGGTGFTQSTIAVTPNEGGSTWTGIVGGSLSVVSITVPGANYTMPPIVAIPAPAPGTGVPATAVATLTGSSVTGISLTNVGAGYTTALATAVLLPNPADPNAGSISQASVTFGLTNAGAVTAVLCTNNGASLAAPGTLTLTANGGAGTGASITPVVLSVLTAISVVAGGAAYGTDSELLTVGGRPTAVSAIGNPTVEFTDFVPRDARAGLNETAGAITTIGPIYDRGLFAGTPAGAVVLSNAIATTVANITPLTGAVADTITLQPAN